MQGTWALVQRPGQSPSGGTWHRPTSNDDLSFVAACGREFPAEWVVSYSARVPESGGCEGCLAATGRRDGT